MVATILYETACRRRAIPDGHCIQGTPINIRNPSYLLAITTNSNTIKHLIHRLQGNRQGLTRLGGVERQDFNCAITFPGYPMCKRCRNEPVAISTAGGNITI